MEEPRRSELLAHVLDLEARLYEVMQVGPASGWLQIDLTLPQLKTMVVLAGPGSIRMSQLSQMLGTNLSTMTGIVDRLVERGLVERGADPEDRRIVLVQLAEQGRREISRLFSLGSAQLAALLDVVSTADLEMVARTMDILHRAALTLRARTDNGLSGHTAADVDGEG